MLKVKNRNQKNICIWQKKYYVIFFFSHNTYVHTLFFILVNTAKASADLAYTLQAALMTQQIKEQETQVKVIERRQEIELQEQVKQKGFKKIAWI